MSKVSKNDRESKFTLLAGAKNYVIRGWGEFIRQPVVVLLNYLIPFLFGGIGLAAYLSDTISPRQLLHWLGENPGLFLSYLGWALLATTILQRLYFVAISRRRKTVRSDRTFRAMGLVDSFTPDIEGTQHQWAHCTQFIETTMPTELQILGATGWHTFADENAPLRALVDSFTGHLKILLIDPTSDGTRNRIDEISIGPTGSIDPVRRKDIETEFMNELNKTIEYCQSLAKKPSVSLASIEVRGYVEKPIWKLILANNFAWVQHYKIGTHVAKTPMYVFSHNDHPDETSFFYAFRSVFNRRWNDSASKVLLLRDAI